jgi:hypothetical protein
MAKFCWEPTEIYEVTVLNSDHGGAGMTHEHDISNTELGLTELPELIDGKSINRVPSQRQKC